MRQILLLVLVLPACGEARPLEFVEPGPVLVDPCADPNACIEEEKPPIKIAKPSPRTPRVELSPKVLMFYGELQYTPEDETRVITVRNTTTSTVLVTNAYVVGSHWEQGQGDAGFFVVEAPDIAEPMGPYEEQKLYVTFRRSSEQRTALLVVETTHPAYISMTAELTGKYFSY